MRAFSAILAPGPKTTKGSMTVPAPTWVSQAKWTVSGAHGHAGGEEGLALDLLKQGLGLGELGLGVHAHHGVLAGHDGAGRSAMLAREGHDIGQIVFALGVVVGDAGQQVEQQAGGRGHDAGVAGGERQDLGRGLLGLGDGGQDVAVNDQTAIGARVAGLEANDGDPAPAEHRLDVGGPQQGHVAVGDDHLSVEVGEQALSRAHGVTGAQRRVLDGDGGGAQPLLDMGADLGRVVSDDHDDALTAQTLGGVDGVVQHGAVADAVQHLGQRRLHARALAGGEDDGGPSCRVAGHESVRRLVTTAV